ncbi:MAG: hypothetical protein U5K43_02385 [Halofilum sp. (in: g-proteobacteria)]|nr:hypothetical protein [Halofilum sp. (in: g-proteobacteria)]
MSGLADALAALAALLPAAGIAATVLAARAAHGATRWLALAAIPGATVVTCLLAAEPVFRRAEDATAANAYILFAAALALYYPLLALAWAVSRYRALAQRLGETDHDR